MDLSFLAHCEQQDALSLIQERVEEMHIQRLHKQQKLHEHRYLEKETKNEQKNGLVVDHFVRDIQTDMDKIIPSSMNYVCLLFYHIPLIKPRKLCMNDVKPILEAEAFYGCATIKINRIGGLKPELIDGDLFHWRLKVKGPKNTPYEGGTFKVRLDFSTNYPSTPPKIWIETKMYHCNIDRKGNTSLDISNAMKGNSMSKVQNILNGVKWLLAHPDVRHPMNPESAKLYKENKEEYYKMCKQWTVKLATDQQRI